MPTPNEKRQLKRIERELTRTVERCVSTIARAVHVELVRETPKQTGNLATNWIPSVRAPFDSGPVPVGRVGERTGAAATSAGLARLTAFRLTDCAAYVSNRVGYAGDVILDDRPGFMEDAIAAAIRAAERKCR